MLVRMGPVVELGSAVEFLGESGQRLRLCEASEREERDKRRRRKRVKKKSKFFYCRRRAYKQILSTASRGGGRLLCDLQREKRQRVSEAGVEEQGKNRKKHVPSLSSLLLTSRATAASVHAHSEAPDPHGRALPLRRGLGLRRRGRRVVGRRRRRRIRLQLLLLLVLLRVALLLLLLLLRRSSARVIFFRDSAFQSRRNRTGEQEVNKRDPRDPCDARLERRE